MTTIEALDRLPGFYDTGTATVTKGSNTVFGQDVNWIGIVFPNDYFWAFDGSSVRIEEVGAETLTLAYAFQGESQEAGAYEIRFADNAVRIAETTRRLIELLSQKAFFRQDAEGDLAGRDDYDLRPKGFSYLDMSVNPMQLYIKLSDADGDWSDGVNYMQGPAGEGEQGPPGPGLVILGTVADFASLPDDAELGDVYQTEDDGHLWVWDGAEWDDLGELEGPAGREIELQTSVTHIQWRYVGDVSWTDLIALADITGADGGDGWSPVLAIVNDGSRRVLQVSDWVGGTGSKPATGDYVGASGLTGTIGSAVDIRGPAGAGTGDVTTTGSVTSQRLVRYADASGDSIEDAGYTVAGVLSTDNHTDGTTNKVFTATEKTKLSGIETAADVTDAGNVGSSIHGASAKTTPVDADTVPLIDSAASNVLKKVTWANVKATLLAYFDTVYQPLASALTSWAAITRASGFDTFVGTPSSANLRSLLTDETGTGAAVFATSPTLVTPALGTPSSVNLSNGTALPVSGITGSTSTALGVGSLELGHATDTTLSRGAAGFMAVEGNRVPSPASQASGDVLYRGSTEWERLPKGTAGQVLKMNSGATAPEWGTGGGGVTVLTALAATSGTTKEFTSLPSTMVVFRLSVEALSTTGTGVILLQIGESSGGYATSSYVGATHGIASGDAGNTWSSGGALTNTGGAAATTVLHGIITLCLLDPSTNTWSISGVLNRSNSAAAYIISGTKSLSGAMDRVRLITTDAFDAGKVGGQYQTT